MSPSQVQVTDDNDRQLLTDVTTYAPDQRNLYEQNLKEINDYIADAKQEIERNPNDSAAHRHLLAAYAHKAMLHRMALNHQHANQDAH